MTLRGRLVLLVVAFVMLLAIAAGAAAAITVARDRRRQTNQDLTVARERVTQLTAAYLDQETGLRGYVITAEPPFLDPYRRGQDASRTILGDLRHLLGSGYDDGLSTISTRANQWTRDAAAPAIAATRSGDAGLAGTLVAGGKTDFDRLRGALTGTQLQVNRAAVDTAASTGRLRAGSGPS